VLFTCYLVTNKEFAIVGNIHVEYYNVHCRLCVLCIFSKNKLLVKKFCLGYSELEIRVMVPYKFTFIH